MSASRQQDSDKRIKGNLVALNALVPFEVKRKVDTIVDSSHTSAQCYNEVTKKLGCPSFTITIYKDRKLSTPVDVSNVRLDERNNMWFIAMEPHSCLHT